MRSHEHKIYTPPKRGLVLSGGGARGAYQVGCFKAFKELGLDFPIVAGTSVGALNGALYCLDDLARTEQIWTSIATGDVLDVPSLIAGLVPLLGPPVASLALPTAGRKRKPWDAVLDITRTVLNAWRIFNRANKEKLARLLDLYLDPVALKNARRELIITITTLRGILPLLFSRQTLAGPSGIRSRILQVHIDDRMIFQAGRELAVVPMLQEVRLLPGRVAGSLEEFGILSVGHRRQVNRVRLEPDLAVKTDDLMQTAAWMCHGLLAWQLIEAALTISVLGLHAKMCGGDRGHTVRDFTDSVQLRALDGSKFLLGSRRG